MLNDGGNQKTYAARIKTHTMDIISRKTRNEFQEFFVTKTLREISSYFENNNIKFSELPEDRNYGGQRRTLVENYYCNFKWADPKEVKNMLNVYEEVLLDLSETENQWNIETNKKWLEKLTRYLLRDGFSLENGKIVSVGQVASFEDLQNATDLLDKKHFNEYIERIKIPFIMTQSLQ